MASFPTCIPAATSLAPLLALLKQQRVISVLSGPAQRLGDPRALILLSQAVYWTVHDKSVLPAGGWLSKPAAEWSEETHLSRSHLTSAAETLHTAGVLKIWQEGRKAPWWKVHTERLAELCHGTPFARNSVPLARFCTDADYRTQITGGRPMPYYTALAAAAGDALLGLFISRCCHWHSQLASRKRLSEDDSLTWGWPSSDWFADIGLTRSQLRTAMKRASELGWITVTEIGRPFPGVVLREGNLQIAVKAKNMPSTNSVHTSTQNPNSWDFAGDRAHTFSPPLPAKPPSAIAGFDKSNAEFAQSIAGFAQPIAGFSRSTRARGFDYLKIIKTTTTPPLDSVYCPPPLPPLSQVVVNEELIFPAKISPLDHPSLRQALAAAATHRRQALLDELAGRMAAQASTPVHNPAAYLRRLVAADVACQGTLALDYAPHIQAARDRQRAIEVARAHASTPPGKAPPPAAPIEPTQRIAPDFSQLRAALRGRKDKKGDPV